MQVYKNDSGHYIEEDDFMQLLRYMKITTKKELSRDQFIKVIWEDDYFGDSIINEECFMAMKLKF